MRSVNIIADYPLRGGWFGTEAVVEVRRRCGPDVPGILLTRETGPESAHEAAAHGLAVLHKPVVPRQLSAILKEEAGGNGPDGQSTTRDCVPAGG